MIEILSIAALVAIVGRYFYATSRQPVAGFTSPIYKTPDLTAAAPASVAVAAPPPNNLPLIAIAVLALGLGYTLYQQRTATKPTHTGILGSAFSTNDDRSQAVRDATKFSKLCANVSDILEDDAKLQPTPFYKTGVQVDDLRRRVRVYLFRGKSLQAQYPGLGPAVDNYLTAMVGTSGGPFDSDTRSKYIAGFRGLSAAAMEAAK
jgi:hypothetical protein